jgi:Polysulphide reductase, NrfD
VGALIPDPEPTYYDLPALKAPVWTWTIPVYFYTGGLAGAASLIGAVAQRLDPRGLRRLIDRAHWASAIGDTLSAGLLIHDLGRPSRFLNMLRVFRPTSPMSLGSWLLAASGASNALAVVACGRGGALDAIGGAAGHVGGALGMPLAGYTAVLLADTAVPIWQGGRRALPILFMGSAVDSAGTLLGALRLDRRSQAAAHRYAILGKVVTLAAGIALEREVTRAGRVQEPLHRGLSGALWWGARALTVASLAAALGPRRRWLRMAGAALGTAGAIGMRFAIAEAGKASARDPRAVFRQQREAQPSTRSRDEPITSSAPSAPSRAHAAVARAP